MAVMDRKILLGLALGILSVSTGSLFARLAEAPPLVISAYRIGAATLFLAPFALTRCRHEYRALSRADFLQVFLAGSLLALHFATWITSLFYTTVASSVVLVNTIPIWVGLFGPMITGDRVGRTMALAMGLVMIGGAIVGAGDFTLSGRALIGDGLALAGGISAALYFLMGRRVRGKLSLLGYIFLCYGSAALILWVLIIAMGQPLVGFPTQTWVLFAAMGLIPQILGHSAYNWALRWVSPGLVSVALLGEPLTGTFLAWLFLGEALTATKVLGGAVILVGIVLASRGESRRSAQTL